MKKKKLINFFISLIAVPFMLALLPVPTYISAANTIFNTDFANTSDFFPWFIITRDCTSMSYNIADGKCNFVIRKPYRLPTGCGYQCNCQFTRSGFNIQKGHIYTVSYEITSDMKGEYYCYITDLSNNGSFDTSPKIWCGNGDVTIESSITGKTQKKDMHEPCWGLMSIEKNETIKYFATFTAQSSADNATISFDLSGHDLYTHSGCFPTDTHLVFDNISIIDQTAENTENECKINEYTDFNNLREDALNYFYLNRSNTDIEEKYITAHNYDNQIEAGKKNGFVVSSDRSMLAHKDWQQNKAYVQYKWLYSYYHNTTLLDKDQIINTQNGWYDCGNYNKYICEGAQSAWLLANIYERSVKNGTEKKYDDGTMSIPENNNGIPDLLDEIKHEIDFMMTMIVPDGEYKNMVYSSFRNQYNTIYGIPEDQENCYLDPPSTNTTLSFAAVAAQFSRLYKSYDPDYAEKCLNAAKKAYTAAFNHPDCELITDSVIKGGPYVNAYDDKSFYWASCEIWITTKLDKYYRAGIDDTTRYLSVLADTSISEIENKFFNYFPYKMYETQSFGTFSLALNQDKLTDEEKNIVLSNIKHAADNYIGPVPRFDETSCGKNIYVLNSAVILTQAADILKDPVYSSEVLSKMNYLLGSNSEQVSYITGYGKNPLSHVTSQFWAGYIDPANFPFAPSGVFVTDRSYQKCSLTFNASLACVSDFICDNQDKQISDTKLPDITYGDITNDGKVDITDLTYLSQYLLNDMKFTDSMMAAADVNFDTDVNLADMSHLKQYIMKDNVKLGPHK